jgi:diguanylate cyclase (GGDEF)-like protein
MPPPALLATPPDPTAPALHAVWAKPIVVERRLVTVFQPILDVVSGEIYGYEALTRDRTRPDAGFPADLAGLMRDAGREVEFNLACLRVAVTAFHRTDLAGRLFVNMDPAALRPETVASIEQLMSEHADSSTWHRLVIEVTESTRSDPSVLGEALARLRSNGASIALDDFGEGFASLRLWSQVRPQVVKIDRHFCEGIDADRYKQEFVRSLRRLCARLGILTIAEGVETEGELDTLASLDIRLVQGYLVGRPSSTPQRRLEPALRKVPRAIAVPESRSDRLGRLVISSPTVPPETTTEAVYARFEADNSLQLLPIVRDGVPIGLVERARLTDFLARPFRREVFGRRSVLEVVEREPLVLEEDSLVSDAARLLAEKDEGALDDGVVVTGGGRYLGIVPGRDLMRSIAEQQLQAARYANPLTLLPGNVPIDRAVEERLAARTAFCMAYIDIDHFKPFNDTYGYGTGDEVIRLLGDLLVEHADPDADFVGHIGGDDFVVLYASSDWRQRIDRVLADFAEGARRHFGDEELRLRSFPGRDRDGMSRRFALLTLSVGVVAVPPACRVAKSRLLRVEARAKRQAKREPGSTVCVLDAHDETVDA